MEISRRPYDLFLSHAHIDRGFAEALYDWLSGPAGLRVWFDQTAMAAGRQINQGLERGIDQAKGALVIGTAEAVERGWVQQEFGHALDERARSQGQFTLIVLVVGGADGDLLGRGYSKIPVSEPRLDAALAGAILRALHPPRPPLIGSPLRDVYLSCSWRAEDRVATEDLARAARGQGLRLVGDSPDRPSYGEDRIASIMATCGAFLGLIPDRGEAVARSDGKNPYRYFLREADLAESLGLPTLILAPEALAREDGSDAGWLRYGAGSLTKAATPALDALYQRWAAPAREDHVFFATDLSAEASAFVETARRLIEAVTGMACLTGRDIQGPNIQDGIRAAVQSAQLVIADLSGDDPQGFNINVAAEVAIAWSAGRQLGLMAAGPARRLPFMLQAAGQLEGYGSEADRLGLIRRFAATARRRIVNDEVV